MNALTLCSTEIRQLDGLFSLNDLHVASGGEKKHQPSNFLRVDTTTALIEEIRSSDLRNDPVRIIQGGVAQHQGTYVCKELVYAYAMWISPKFHLAVIRAFDALQSAPQGLPLPFIPAVPGQRYLVSTGEGGQYAVKPIPHDCCVMTPAAFLKGLADHGSWLYPVASSVLFAAIEKLAAQLRVRSARGLHAGDWS